MHRQRYGFMPLGYVAVGEARRCIRANLMGEMRIVQDQFDNFRHAVEIIDRRGV
jgi:hypothetical protein